jgi:hypothetical protein
MERPVRAMQRAAVMVTGGVVALTAASAGAQVSLLTQERTATAFTSFDAVTATQTAPNFAPFIADVGNSVVFTTAAGAQATNAAQTTINCLADPNAITATGSLRAAGGLAVSGGPPAPVFGEASALVLVSFDVLTPTPFLLTASPRPSTQPGDEYELELSGDGSIGTLLAIDEDLPPQAVFLEGVLAPGRYTFTFQVELTASADLTEGTFGVALRIPTPSAGLALAMAGLMAARRRRH